MWVNMCRYGVGRGQKSSPGRNNNMCEVLDTSITCFIGNNNLVQFGWNTVGKAWGNKR